jgi:Fatty acid hydroxylase superfamily
MASAAEIRAAALVKGLALKHTNALTALLCGAVPGLLFDFWRHAPLHRWLLGLAIGLIWANAFEYFYHRYLLHWPKSSFGKGHLLHHLTTGGPEEPEHVTFGNSPIWVAMLFAVNGIPTVLADAWLRVGLAPGILTGFSLYLIAVEEIHWRIHLGGWLPPGLGWAREYHMAHHDIPEGRFNVFFPIFDFLLGNIRPPLAQTEAAAMARAVPACVPSDPYVLLALEKAVVWLWIFGLAIGARYFWNTSSKL